MQAIDISVRIFGFDYRFGQYAPLVMFGVTVGVDLSEQLARCCSSTTFRVDPNSDQVQIKIMIMSKSKLFDWPKG